MVGALFFARNPCKRVAPYLFRPYLKEQGAYLGSMLDHRLAERLHTPVPGEE